MTANELYVKTYLKKTAVTYSDREPCQYRFDVRAGWTDQEGKGHLPTLTDLLYKVIKIRINIIAKNQESPRIGSINYLSWPFLNR